MCLVKQVRKRLPRSGGVNLWRIVQRFLRLFHLPTIGRDRFANIVGRCGLKVRYSKRGAPRTTYSNHPYAIHPNLLKDLKVTGPEQVLVGDITYLNVGENHAYLFLLTDVSSRYIVGHYLSKNLRHTGAEAALRSACEKLSSTEQVIHHTDRGSQYCCHEFLDALKERGMTSSMTDNDHAAQNALAEYINGILKREFGLWDRFRTFESAEKAVSEAIFNYNHYRIHGALKGKTPVEAHYGDYTAFQDWALEIVHPQLPQTFLM